MFSVGVSFKLGYLPGGGGARANHIVYAVKFVCHPKE